MAHRLAAAVAAALLAAGLVACSDGDDGPHTYYGAERAMGNGQIRTFVTTDGDGTPTEVGLRIQEDAVQGLPAGDGMSMTAPMASPALALPEQAAGTVVDHLTFDWVPHGHPPVGVFDQPHFDTHFYFVDAAAVQAIDPADPDFLTEAAVEPAPRYMPAGYVTIPGEPIEAQAVPYMGVHWVNPAGVVPGQFTQTLINGAWNGQYIFTEPMFTREWLLTKPDFSGEIAQPQAYQHTGRYPTTYAITFDDQSKEYVVTLGGMTERTAS
ncbi:DUF5602 domain-containing protein [Nocardia thailandica]|uniref:DUF5602 domain-containing protein n=1 Tax=Nocardia thailandica TaxID=257275 RepID=UPI00031DD474|nr:DUF5602 domain-containing protein [Nocardia thailandica]